MTEPAEMVKIEIFIPEAFLQELHTVLIKEGIGVIGDYDACLTVIPVQGFWRPLENAKPFDGEVGEISQGSELKVEVNCLIDKVQIALNAIKSVHPYEEPVINIIPLLNHKFK